MTNRDSRRAGPTNLAELSRKTGLVIRSVDSEVISRLFVEIEKYDVSAGEKLDQEAPRERRTLAE